MLYNKIKKIPDLGKKLKKLRSEGKSIVFTNGCFDIIHAGHVSYLSRASAMGDVLVVGLNSDRSVKALKGKDRPVIKEKYRARVLAGLRAVDFVVIFNEKTPLRLIKKVDPDILVKGGDWKISDIVGGDHVRKKGGKVISLPYIKGLSTNTIIKKIKKTQ